MSFLTVTDPLGHTTHLRYDARGNATATIDALGNETDFTFNIDDRPLSTLYPATGQSGAGRGSTQSNYLYSVGGSATVQYGPLASVQTFDEGNTSGAFRTVSYRYGPEGETLGVSGSTEPVTYAYDAVYRLTALTDGNGHATRYFYNTQGYLAQVAYPGAGASSSPLAAGTADTITYTGYDGNGDVTRRVDGNGTATAYTYADPESLLTGIHYAPGSGVAPLADTTYQYDQYGRRSVMTDATGGQTYGYSDDDRLFSDTTAYTGLPTQTVGYTYAPDGSRNSISTPAGAFTYTYDNAGRETALSNPAGQSFAFAYLANDWLASQQSGGALVASYAYNARGQLTEINNHAPGGSPLSDFAVPSSGGYDGAGNRTYLASSLPDAAGDGGGVSYQYDARNQLTGEAGSRNGGYSNAFAHDGAENPTTFRGGAVGAANADNQLPGDTYDGDGSPVGYHGNSLTFDPESRLAQRSGPAFGFYVTLTNSYTGDGLRGEKRVNSFGFPTAYFLYDGDQPVCELNSAGAVTAVDTFGPNGLLARGGIFYSWDLSGNLAQQIDPGSGGVLGSAAIDAYGLTVTTNTSGDPFSFLGGQWGYYTDTQAQNKDRLTLCTHRFYDTTTGRFLTRDPIGYKGGVNLYGYVTNNPVNETDALGFSPNNKKSPLQKCKDWFNDLPIPNVIWAIKCASDIQQARIDCIRNTPPDPIEDPTMGNGDQINIACIQKELAKDHLPNINACLKRWFNVDIKTLPAPPNNPGLLSPSPR